MITVQLSWEFMFSLEKMQQVHHMLTLGEHDPVQNISNQGNCTNQAKTRLQNKEYAVCGGMSEMSRKTTKH